MTEERETVRQGESQTKLANLVLGFHVVWGLGIVALALIATWKKEWRGVSLAVTYATCSAQWMFGGCPLTLLEWRLRGDESAWTKGFVVHYAEKWFGFRLSPWFVVCVLAGILGLHLYWRLS